MVGVFSMDPGGVAKLPRIRKLKTLDRVELIVIHLLEAVFDDIRNLGEGMRDSDQKHH